MTAFPIYGKLIQSCSSHHQPDIYESKSHVRTHGDITQESHDFRFEEAHHVGLLIHRTGQRQDLAERECLDRWGWGHWLPSGAVQQFANLKVAISSGIPMKNADFQEFFVNVYQRVCHILWGMNIHQYQGVDRNPWKDIESSPLHVLDGCPV